MSKILHPDRVADLNKKAEAEEKFKLITQIKALLLNKHAKALYDKEGVVTIDTDIDTTNSAICVSAQEIDQLKNIYKGKIIIYEHSYYIRTCILMIVIMSILTILLRRI